MDDDHALVESEVVLCVDELTVHTVVLLIDEVHTKIISVGATLERTV